MPIISRYRALVIVGLTFGAWTLTGALVAAVSKVL